MKFDIQNALSEAHKGHRLLADLPTYGRSGRGVLTLYIWHVPLVLVRLTTEQGEGESLEEQGALLKLLVLTAEQVQGAGLYHRHST